MADQITNYQCPACTGPLHYNERTGKLECDYCGSTYDVAEIEALYAKKDKKASQAMQQEEAERQEKGKERKKTEKPSENTAEDTAGDAAEDDWDTSDMTGDWGDEAKNMKVYNCPSCGAELICDESTAATSCPYCGNPAIVPGRFSGALKPDYVIPFRLSKEDAVAALKKHYKGKIFLPRSFSSENHLQEIKGIYVPFWMFDGAAEGWVECEATRSHTHISGDYKITDTEHFRVYRQGTLNFSKVPVDASSKMPDDYMDSIEPFDYKEMKAFSTAYLPGFLADKYDVTAQQSRRRADIRCENTLVASLESTISGYESVTTLSKSVKLRRGKVHYAMLPVWTLHTRWNGKDFLFAMNGQTGRMAGDLPVSRGRFLGMFAAVAGVLSALSTIIVLLCN